MSPLRFKPYRLERLRLEPIPISIEDLKETHGEAFAEILKVRQTLSRLIIKVIETRLEIRETKKTTLDKNVKETLDQELKDLEEFEQNLRECHKRCGEFLGFTQKSPQNSP